MANVDIKITSGSRGHLPNMHFDKPDYRMGHASDARTEGRQVIAYLRDVVDRLEHMFPEHSSEPAAIVELGPQSTLAGAKITGNVTVRRHPGAVVELNHFAVTSATAIEIDAEATGSGR